MVLYHFHPWHNYYSSWSSRTEAGPSHRIIFFPIIILLVSNLLKEERKFLFYVWKPLIFWAAADASSFPATRSGFLPDIWNISYTFPFPNTIK